jgi:hypothetical protein
MSRSNSEGLLRAVASDWFVRLICVTGFIIWGVNLFISIYEGSVNGVCWSAGMMVACGATYALGTWE